MFKTMIQNWKRKEREKQFKDGFDFAAGALLRREHTPMSLESFFFGRDMSQFDFGIDAAIDIIVGLNFVYDDRI